MSEDLVNFTAYIGFLPNIWILRFKFRGPSDYFSGYKTFLLKKIVAENHQIQIKNSDFWRETNSSHKMH